MMGYYINLVASFLLMLLCVYRGIKRRMDPPDTLAIFLLAISVTTMSFEVLKLKGAI